MIFRKLKELKNKINSLFGITDDWEIIRRFDLKAAEKFFKENQNNLQEMALCMGLDYDVWEPIIEDGIVIRNPITLSNVSGVETTVIDVPCIYYKYKSGVEGKLACFRYWEYSSKLKCHKRPAVMGVGYELAVFKPFNPEDYVKTYQKFKELYCNVLKDGS